MPPDSQLYAIEEKPGPSPAQENELPEWFSGLLQVAATALVEALFPVVPTPSKPPIKTVPNLHEEKPADDTALTVAEVPGLPDDNLWIAPTGVRVQQAD